MTKNIDKRDYSLDLMRFIAIVVLVLYHSFAMYTNNWSNPQGMQEIGIYNWIGRLLSRVSFQSFTFLAGYIFMMQILKNKWSYRQLVLTKAKRLLMPSVIFSIFYILLFGNLSVDSVGHIVSGAGHMWYLPMLFCTFLIGFFILQLSDILIGTFLIVFIIGDAFLGNDVSLPYILRPIISMIKCMPFFITGALCNKHKYLILNLLPLHTHTLHHMLDGKNINPIIIRCVLIFFVSLILLSILMYGTLDDNDFIANSSRCLFSIVVCFLLWLTATFMPTGNKDIIVDIATASMGIYLFHQFILEYIIYNTSLPMTVGWWLTPFICFFIALNVSLLLAMLSRKIPLLKQIL